MFCERGGTGNVHCRPSGARTRHHASKSEIEIWCVTLPRAGVVPPCHIATMQKRNPKRHAACFVDYLCSALGESRSTESHVYIDQGHNGRAVFLLFLFLALYSERFLPGFVHVVDDDAAFR